MTDKPRVRFAPSPTGSLHIGGAHTALFNWLYARRNGGSFILRIEDTDMERSTKEYEQSILDGMRWMGLDWDEGPDKGGDFGPYRQSERMHLYKKYAQQLLDEGKAYEKDGAVFFKVVPGKELRFRDEVYGNLDFKSENASVNQDGTIKDIVIMKRDGMPTYNYAVVIDDYTMGINMVIRGEDHIINTPKQLLIYDALGFLSKRQGATSVFEYNDMGYLPDGVFNFLALLGWSPKNGQEIFSREEAVEMFDISAVTRKAAVLDMDKLNHINQEQMKIMDPMKLLAVIRPRPLGPQRRVPRLLAPHDGRTRADDEAARRIQRLFCDLRRRQGTLRRIGDKRRDARRRQEILQRAAHRLRRVEGGQDGRIHERVDSRQRQLDEGRLHAAALGAHGPQGQPRRLRGRGAARTRRVPPQARILQFSLADAAKGAGIKP